MTENPGPPALQPLEEDFGRVLCVVAHPDDIEYGTSAAVHRWTSQGKEVTYLLVTRGEAGIDTMPPGEAAPAREQEERDGAAVVGVDVVEFLEGYRDGVVEDSLALRRDLARAIRRLRPDLVVTLTFEHRFGPGAANQADHRVVGLAVLDAAAAAGNRWIFPELVDDGLEPWKAGHGVAVVGSSHPTHYVDCTDHVDAGVASLEAHRRYNDALPDDYPAPAELVPSILARGREATGVEHALVIELFG